jgi:hypothetical protein
MITITVLLCLFSLTFAQYSLRKNYTGNAFFDDWDFFTAGDPTHGTVNYVNQSYAQEMGYINTDGGSVYIGCDYKRNVAGNSRGRDSVRISSKASYRYGLFIMDLSHMPTGCGTWPAWWLVGPNWPSGGEIDIIEGVNTATNDQTTLHTNAGCDMSKVDKNSFTGRSVSTNCLGNSGCGIVANMANYGEPFNQAGGGVYVMEWTTDFIRTFYFGRNNVPQDINSGKPQPNNWGKPYALFDLGSNCPDSHFVAEVIVINLTFCGDWAGNVFSQQCKNMGTCSAFVKDNPNKFSDAYWRINYVSVFH